MINIFSYNKNKLKEISVEDIEKNSKTTFWIDLETPTQEEINSIKEKFDIHPTTQEDMVLNHTRIKYEEFEENTFVVFKGIKNLGEYEIETYNISFLIGENYLITCHSGKNEYIENLARNHRRIESFLKKGKGYIFHYVLDKEMDKCMNIKVGVFEEFKRTEKRFVKNPEKEVLEEIFKEEQMILELRQLMESLTDLCLNLTKPTENYLENELLPYLRDIYDHSFKTTESLKSMLGRINGMRNAYQSIISNKLNDTMRILTLIMAIMMPMTVITGFYGMNIRLPLQEHPQVWTFLIGLMVGVSILMYFIFRRVDSRKR